MYIRMHVSVHTDLQSMPHKVVKATYTSTAVQPRIQLKNLLPRHKELVHTCHTQKGPHEQTPP